MGGEVVAEDYLPLGNTNLYPIIKKIKSSLPLGGTIINTLNGDPDNGKIEYQLNCMACHQKNGKGNEQLYAPSLVGLSDVYIVNQLIKYRDGVRGSGNGDKHGRVMQSFAKNLKNEQVMKDIAAYLISLQY